MEMDDVKKKQIEAFSEWLRGQGFEGGVMLGVKGDTMAIIVTAEAESLRADFLLGLAQYLREVDLCPDCGYPIHEDEEEPRGRLH